MTTPLLHLIFLVGAMLIAAGCTRPLSVAVHVANTAAVGLKATHGGIAAASRSAQRAAARRVVGERDDPSVRAEQVDRATEAGRRYRPAWNAYDAARAAWIAVADGIRMAQQVEAAGGEPDVQLVAALLVVLADAQRELTEVFSQ